MKALLINKNGPKHKPIELYGSKNFDTMTDYIDLDANNFYEFTSENGFVLLCGMSNEYCCVQFSHENGEPPYEVAVSPIPLSINSEINYYIDNTATEVPNELCISTKFAYDIIKYFLDHGEKFPAIEWQEI